MPELQRLRADYALAVLNFEWANRDQYVVRADACLLPGQQSMVPLGEVFV